MVERTVVGGICQGQELFVRHDCLKRHALPALLRDKGLCRACHLTRLVHIRDVSQVLSGVIMQQLTQERCACMTPSASASRL